MAVVLGGTSLMGGKFSIAGTVIGVFIIKTLESTILFLGIPSAQKPTFFGAVVMVVVIIQSPRMRAWMRKGKDGVLNTIIKRPVAQKNAEEVAS